MSTKPPNANKPNAEAFSEALARIEQARKTGATELDLSRLGLTELPESLGQLTQLQELDLFKNQLTALPEWLSQLTQLQELYLFKNKFTALPEALGQLTQLQKLYLSDNQLTALPASLGQLTQFQELDLSGNKLRVLPELLGQLTQLQKLYLIDNQLTVLPEFLSQLTQLRVLNLGANELLVLPDSLGQLTQLQELYLSGNQLTALPESLRQLKSLEQLFLHGNEALVIPAEVLGSTSNDVIKNKAQPAKPSAILDYYFRTRGGRRPLNEAKLILVGRGAVGKTSLANRLVHNRFSKKEKKTEDIQITEWRLRLNRKEEVRLNIWDFGGQEIMHATHQFFLTERSLYLLVFNGREGGEDADAEYWLKLIESFGSDSPVIVVLNKIKEHPFDLNRRALQQKYPIREFIKTDCEDGTGIAELRKIIEAETGRLEHLRDAFPASWFSIKDRLAAMKKNYLSFEEYRKVCTKNGETEAAAQEQLAFYLHRLGIVLNYKDDPRLQDTHVLNPHWVTNGIYKILNAEKLANQKGVIHLKEVSSILDGKKYPGRMHRFLFDLMKKFEICFSFPDDDTQYLIPELLDKQEPEDTKDFSLRSYLNFEYHYPILPEGLPFQVKDKKLFYSTQGRTWDSSFNVHTSFHFGCCGAFL